MKYLAITLAGILTSIGIAYVFNREEPLAVGAPATEITFQKNLIPLSDSRYTIGTTTKAWLNGFFDELCLAGDCKTAWPTGGAGGGGGMTVYFQNGGATLNTATTTINFTPNSFSVVENPTDTLTIRIATTTLGLLTTNVSEGSNLYYTDARVSAYMSASSTYTSLQSFYTTPSTRITAGTGIDWSGNTLNGVYTAGDALTLTGEDFDFDGGATPGGALGGTWASPTVDDDGHAHTGATLSGIDISSDTNLSADGTEIILTGDALSLGTQLTYTSATATNMAVSGALNLYSAGYAYTANALCIQLTGSAALCDGTDATSAGGGGISTSSIPVAGNLAYWTSASTLSDVATGTLTTTATGLELSATRGLIGGSSILSLTSGYFVPTTTRAATWDLAHSWGNHGAAGYVTQGQTVGTTTAGVLGQASYWTGARTLGTVATGTLTESVLGLELDNSTRGLFGGSAALSLTSGYLIPTTTRAATWDLANSWGNHAVAGYISDGNTGWDNLYGLITATNATASITTATTTNLAIPTSLSLFGGEKVTTANALCIQLTGSADLCDGGDASGGGGGVSDWIKNAALDAIRPTTTVGIVVSASSSISELNTASLRVNSDTVTDLTGFGMAVGSGALGLLQTGAADGECLKYVAAGPTIDWASCGGAATAGGNDEEIQFNDGTSLGGASLFTFDNETGRLGLGTTSPAAVFAIASSTYNYSIPLFMIATSSDPSGSLFSVFATTTAAANATGTTNISNGARVLIGTLPSYLRSANISSEFYVNGNVDTSYWNYQCNARNAITAPGADAQFACGDAAYQEDTTGAGTTLSNLSVRISDRAFGITDATANGGAGFFFDAVSARTVLASTTPTFEATINVFTGTTTARVGFFNIDPAGTAFEVGPTVGVYFTASSSLSNWQFVVKGIGVESVFDSGVPSTTDAFIRIKTDSQNAYGWIGTPSSQMKLVGTAAINVGSINTTQMTSGAYQARTLGGSASAGLQLQSMELWMRKLYAQFNY